MGRWDEVPEELCHLLALLITIWLSVVTTYDIIHEIIQEGRTSIDNPSQYHKQKQLSPVPPKLWFAVRNTPHPKPKLITLA